MVDAHWFVLYPVAYKAVILNVGYIKATISADVSAATTETHSEEILLSQLENIPDAISHCGTAFGIVIVCLGIFGNTLVVLSILYDRRLRRRMNVFIASMAIADLFLVLGRDPVILDIYMRGSYGFDQKLLSWLYLSTICRNTFGMEHVVAITMYRYVYIVHNVHVQKLLKMPVILALLVFIYVFPLLAAIGSLPETVSITSANESLFLNTKFMQVTTKSGMMEKILKATRKEFDIGPLSYILGYILLNALILCGCYLHLFIFLRRSRKRLQTWGTRRADLQISKANQRETKIIKTMAIIFLLFIVMYVSLPLVSAAGQNGVLYSHWLYFPFFILNWTSSCSNWIIYVLNNEVFRDAFRHLLGIPKKTRVRGTPLAEEPKSMVEETTVFSIAEKQHMRSVEKLNFIKN